MRQPESSLSETEVRVGYEPRRARRTVGVELALAAVDRSEGGGTRSASAPEWDWASTPSADLPLVSMILTTRDRPDFFPVALACCRHQTYAHRELIVIDDGDRYPVDAALIAAEGGRLVRTEPGTPIGSKLNAGIDVAGGYLCLVIDDDDWYGPGYIATMVARLLADWHEASRASMVGAAPYLILDLARWMIVQTIPRHVAGGSLGFRREDWAAAPFRPIGRSVDRHFLADQAGLGTRLLTVAAPEDFLGVRHRGVGNNRGHTWIDERGYIDRLPSWGRSPDDLLPSWAVAFYRRLSNEQRSEFGATSPIARLLARVRRTEP